MSLRDTVARFWARISGDHGPVGPSAATEPTESDVGHDPRSVAARVAGGRHRTLDGDRGSTTGTGETGVHVGQVAGDDLGHAELSGAEARAMDEGTS